MCGCAARLDSDLVGNAEDRFCRDVVHFKIYESISLDLSSKSNIKLSKLL